MLYYSLLASSSDTTIVPDGINYIVLTGQLYVILQFTSYQQLVQLCIIEVNHYEDEYLYILLTDPDNESWRSSQETLVPEEFEPENGNCDLTTLDLYINNLCCSFILLKNCLARKKTLEVLLYDNYYICICSYPPCTCIIIFIYHSFRVILNNHCTRQ